MATKHKTTNSKQAKAAAARPPHNAAKGKSFRTVGELAQSVGAEPRKATVRGEQVAMSQAERLCRVMIENAINGSVSDLKFLIRTMADRPEIAGTAQERWVLLLAGSDAKL